MTTLYCVVGTPVSVQLPVADWEMLTLHRRGEGVPVVLVEDTGTEPVVVVVAGGDDDDDDEGDGNGDGDEPAT